MKQAARGGREPAQVSSSVRAAQLGPRDRSPLPIRRTRERSGRPGLPGAPVRGRRSGWGRVSPLSGNRRDKGCGARPQLHVAPGSRLRELRRGGAVGWSPRRAGWGRPRGEHTDWAGTTGEAGPPGLLHRTTAVAPASRLLQACTRHRPQLGPTPRPPAASAGVAARSRTPSSLGSGEPTLSRDSAPAVPALERPPIAAAAAAAAVARVTVLKPGRGRAGGRGGQGAGRRRSRGTRGVGLGAPDRPAPGQRHLRSSGAHAAATPPPLAPATYTHSHSRARANKTSCRSPLPEGARRVTHPHPAQWALVVGPRGQGRPEDHEPQEASHHQQTA